jgi:hypothetical protein
MVDESPRLANQPETYERTFEVSIDGLVPPAVLGRLGDVEVSSQEMRTVLTGHFRDQSEVYGFLERLRAYALEVVEVRRIGEGELPHD